MLYAVFWGPLHFLSKMPRALEAVPARPFWTAALSGEAKSSKSQCRRISGSSLGSGVFQVLGGWTVWTGVICINKHISLYMYIYIYTDIHIYMCVYTYVHMYIYIYVYIHIYKYTHICIY